MKTYIALLRGINVSGQKIIKMEILRKVLMELDLENISTYIQSGNLLFESKIADSRRLENMIATKIKAHFGFDIPTVVLTLEELRAVVKKNPYVKENLANPTQPYVAFLSGVPALSDIEILGRIDFQNDRFHVIGKTIYLHYANSAGKTKLSNGMIENKLKIKSTSRNWKTVLKLIELSEAMHS